MEVSEINRISNEVIGAAIEVHRALGPGLLESAYEECLCRELSLRDLRFRRQLEIPVEYKGVRLACGYRVDVLVEETVIVEVKAIERVVPVHEAPLLTDLRMTGNPLGLILNFNVPVLRQGIRRLVNNR